jgi:hypothetical protein
VFPSETTAEARRRSNLEEGWVVESIEREGESEGVEYGRVLPALNGIGRHPSTGEYPGPAPLCKVRDLIPD